MEAAPTPGEATQSRPRSASSGGGRSSQRKSSSSSSRPKVCRSCGQHHSHHEPHLYNYKDDVDEDLMCQICLQPFVQPTDTPCAHTFCHACLHAYLRVNPMCPLDRKPVNEMTINPSNLVLKRLLDKLLVTCPNSDSCEDVLQRGSLDDHLRYRCSGTLVACQFAGAGCDYRGPSKSMNKHRSECKFKKEGITRLPVLEGEVSHVEIPRTSQNLGITIVGGADTPLRCVVVQEVYPDGLIAQDGRLQPGDQIIEINGVDMTCASHAQVCAALRKMSSVLRLGVYRERIEKYNNNANSNQRNIGNNKTNGHNHPQQQQQQQAQPVPKLKSRQKAEPQKSSGNKVIQDAHQTSGNKTEELLTVTLERQAGRQLGIRLSGNCSEPGIYIVDIQEGSTTFVDGRLQKFDRLLFINGQDVRRCSLAQASALIQNNDKVSIIVARKSRNSSPIENFDEVDNTDLEVAKESSASSSNGLVISHTRSKSAPAMHHKNGRSASRNGHDHNEDEEDEEDDEDEESEQEGANIELASSVGNGVKVKQVRGAKAKIKSGSHEDVISPDGVHLYDLPQGEDYMAIYETLDRVKDKRSRNQDNQDLKNKSHSMEALETPTPSLKSFEFPDVDDNHSNAPEVPRRRHRSKPQTDSSSARQNEVRKSVHELNYHHYENHPASSAPPPTQPNFNSNSNQKARVYQQEPRPMVSPNYNPGPALHDFPDGNPTASAMAAYLKKALRIEGPQLQQRLVSIKKNVRESLGMRIGGGIGSNEGDTPIYIANIHPHGCIGKSKQMKKGDLLLSVDDVSLCGLTHTQAVATLKATISRSQVVLGVMDGPETSLGASNFIPSWMYWQKLPRMLQYPKTVILHRRENASWGFSIVGGGNGNETGVAEPIHVLFVVPDSPAAKDAKIKCGDRLLAVDGHSLENIPHSMAVAMLKQTSTRVVLEVVSWMGTEI